MDQFEEYLLDKINDHRERLSKTDDDSIRWSLNNCISEFLEILSQYNTKFKIEN